MQPATELVAVGSTSSKDHLPNALYLKEQDGKREKSYHGQIQFVGNISKPKPYLVISDDTQPEPVYEFINNSWKLYRPRVLISITGGAQDFKMKPRLESVFSRGLVRAAENTQAWIVTGGTDSGVMSYVGRAVSAVSAPIPTFGIASFYMITHHDLLRDYNKQIPYKKMIQNGGHGAALDPNHSHFIFVDRGKPEWGAEIAFRTSLEDYITQQYQIPVVLVVVQGGPGTLKTVEEGVKRKFPVILVEGSGGAADAIAICLKQKPKVDTSVLIGQFPYNEAQRKIIENICVMDMQHQTIFPFLLKDNSTSEMDSHILNAILSGTQRPLKLNTKMKLCVEWNRADILKEVLKPKKAAQESQADTQDHQDSLNEAFQKALTLNRTEIYSLLLQHGAQISVVDLVSLYRSRRADNLLNSFVVEGPKDEADSKHRTDPDAEDAELPSHQEDNLKSSVSDISAIFGNIVVDPGRLTLEDVMRSRRVKFPPRYQNALMSFEELQYYTEKTAENNETTATDLLVWAVFSQKDDLAEEIWKTHEFSLHAALLCAYIYGALAEELPGRKADLEKYQNKWEEISYQILDRVTTPEMAHTILEATWPELDLDAVKLAVKAEAKSVVSHQYFQKVLDQRLYTSESGVLETQTSNLRIIMIILFPFLFMTFLRNPFRKFEPQEADHGLPAPATIKESAPAEPTESQNLIENVDSESDISSQAPTEPEIEPTPPPLSEVSASLKESQLIINTPPSRPGKGPVHSHHEDYPWSWAFYSVPIVKLWTKNLAYVLYLGIVSSVALSKFHYKLDVFEYILGFWVTALISDEFYEYHENPEGHFDTVTNKLDFSILVTWVIYFILRIFAAILENDTCNEWSVYLICLIVVAGCLRAMQIFQLNPVIGPLLLMINKMAADIVRFFGMFLLLFIGSQVAMIAVARNIGKDPDYEDEYPNNWEELYPKGVQLLALWGFVGEFSFDALKEWPVGYILLALYILFAAVMMQNLLIAMMADSYTQVNENAETEWKFERFFLVEEQQSASSVPPPFNIFEVIWSRFKDDSDESRSKRDTLADSDKTLISRLNLFRAIYLDAKAAEERKSLSNRTDDLNNRLDNLHTRRIEDREYLDRRFKELKEKVTHR